MRISHNALVLVADGRKSLFLRNDGDAEFPHLIVEDQRAHADLEDRDMKSDAAGRASSPVGGRQSNVDEPNYHQIEEDRFAAETAALLGKRLQDNDFEELIVVAPPRTLGELRQHYGKAVQATIVAEIDKDFVNHPIDKVESALKAL